MIDSLKERVRVEFSRYDLVFTSGGFPGLYCSLKTVVDPGDEVIYLTPSWFFYESIVISCGGTPVAVALDSTTFDVDIEAVRRAITMKTRALFITTPHNPTGRIFSQETLEKLSNLLREASERNQRTIYLISDEAYNRIVFTDSQFFSPVEFYENTFLVHTYTKTLLTPSQRIGYIAISPKICERALIQKAVFTSVFLTTYAEPNATMFYSLAEIERSKIGVSVSTLQQRRDLIGKALKDAGFEFSLPQGSLYIWVKCPIQDEKKFVEILAELDVFVVGGKAFEVKEGSWFRICLTATDKMVEFSLPRWKQAMDLAKQTTTC